MNNNTPTDIKKLIDTMSVEELRQRLSDYMLADNQLPRPVAIEVRLKDKSTKGGRLHLHTAPPSGLSAQKSGEKQL